MPPVCPAKTPEEPMITRLEVDGFKKLLNLQVDLGPFTCIAGVNGAGKLNLFDAVQFLAE
jgi:AAA15 family ATPase/GTPase